MSKRTIFLNSNFTPILASNKNVNILVLDTEVYSNTGGLSVGAQAALPQILGC